MPAKRPGRRKRELAVGEGGDQLTKKELSQLRDLEQEIKILTEEIEACYNRGKVTKDTVQGSSTSHPYTLHPIPISGLPADCPTDRAYIDARVTRLREITAKRVAAYERVLDFVERVEDSRMRNILTMRYIKCMSWQQIAGEIGGGNTANGLYKAHKRFLESEK